MAYLSGRGDVISTFRHVLRLLHIGWTLARHDAFFPLALLGLPQAAIGWLPRLVPTHQKCRGKRDGERLAIALASLGPSFVKLGQAMSVRADLLGEELAEDLGGLRDRMPPFPGDVARAAIAEEFGRSPDVLFETFEDQPVAAASIAQVHFALVGTEEGGPPKPVAVKILRPGIEAAFQRDLELFFWLARLAEKFQPALRRLRPVDVMHTLSESVAIEMDLRLEAAAAAELAENFADDPTFRVPAVDWIRTGRRVLTIDWVEGIRIHDRDALLAAGHDTKTLSVNIIRIFMRQAMRDGFFHADLHQGNLFVAEDGTIVAVDFGIMGRLDTPTCGFLAEMLHAFLTGDYRRAADVHFEAGYVPHDQSREIFAQACRSIGEPIRGKPVNEISLARLLMQLFQITEAFSMQTQPQLLLLQKTMVTAEGVARHLDPEVNFWTAADPLIDEWISENRGPEAQLRDAARAMEQTVRRLPSLMQRLEKDLESREPKTLRLDQETTERLAAALDRRRRGYYAGLAVAVLVIAVVAGLAA